MGCHLLFNPVVCWCEIVDRCPGPRFKNRQLNNQTTTWKERNGRNPIAQQRLQRKEKRDSRRETDLFSETLFHQNTLFSGEVADFDRGLGHQIMLPANKLSTVGVYTTSSVSFHAAVICVIQGFRARCYTKYEKSWRIPVSAVAMPRQPAMGSLPEADTAPFSGPIISWPSMFPISASSKFWPDPLSICSNYGSQALRRRTVRELGIAWNPNPGSPHLTTV